MPRYWVQEFDTLDEQKSTPEKPVYSAVGVASRLKPSTGTTAGSSAGATSAAAPTNDGDLRLHSAGGRSRQYLLSHSLKRDSLAACWQLSIHLFLTMWLGRRFAGTALKYFTAQAAAVLPPDRPTANPCLGSVMALPRGWIRNRVLELSYTAWDMEPLRRISEMTGRHSGGMRARRTLIRAELDAAYFHLYGLERDEVEHVMDSFDALRRREEKPQNFGEFRTKRLILERYDAMTEAMRTGVPYQTVLDPPPGHGPRHPAR